MRRFSDKSIKAIMIVMIVIVSLVLIVTAVSMLVQYSDEVAEQASSKAAYYTLSAKQDVEYAIYDNHTKAVVMASDISKLSSDTELYEYLSTVKSNDLFSDILFVRYFKGDTLYSANGDVYTGIDNARDIHAQRPDHSKYIGTFEDSTTVDGLMSIIGFYAPVYDSNLADAVVVYYTRNKVESFFTDNSENTHAQFSVLCTRSGEIVVGQRTVESSQLFVYLRGMIGDKAPIDKAEMIMSQALDGIVIAKISGEKYIISIAADKEQLCDLCVVELYRADDLYASSFDFIDTIIGIFIIFAIIAIMVVIYLVIHREQLRRSLLNLETMDKKMPCFNRHGFEKEAKTIVDNNKSSYFAVIVFHVRHYKYLTETYGQNEADNLLNYVRVICSKTVQLQEVYGHIEDGQFLLLLHAKDRQALIERLRVHASLATRYKGAHKFDVSLKYGIYEPNHTGSVSLTQMIDLASEAYNAIVRATENNATMQFNFYSDEVRQVRLINEDMELRMEGALLNGEFQVFYQPKYNLNQSRQDGSEALVRWYDPKTGEYNRPALFMPLFESNGFIVKLDKYVYMKVCEYISYSIANGRTVFPVSVNVSRITAVQPDFIDYYTKIKKKYGISDGQIMIEFTESFAYENYETLLSITNALHNGGFKCSIDDFGHGYSSYRILKSLPMDEIKLDKFFLEKGQSEERDNYIIESIVGVAKKLGMKVTQEGVETIKEVERMKKLGCDVIQGYYYSHPLPLTDFITFVQNTREHNIRFN